MENLLPKHPLVESETGETVELLESPFGAQSRMDQLNRRVVTAIHKRADKNGITINDVRNGVPFSLGPAEASAATTFDDQLEACVIPMPRRRFRRAFGF